MRSIFMKAAVMLLAALCLTLSGCAAFPQHQVATVTDMPSVAQYQNKPRVYLDVRMFGMVDPPANVDFNTPPGPRNPQIEAIVMKAAGDSKLFSSYTTDPSQQSSADYTIKLYFYDHGNMGLAMASGFITGFTLGVIPGAATDHYALRSAVVAKDGTVQKTGASEDAVTTWLGIWFIPMMGHTPKDAIEQTIGNLTLASFKDMVQSNTLKYSALDLPRHHF